MPIHRYSSNRRSTEAFAAEHRRGPDSTPAIQATGNRLRAQHNCCAKRFRRRNAGVLVSFLGGVRLDRPEKCC